MKSLPILIEEIEVQLNNITTTSAPKVKALFAELKTLISIPAAGPDVPQDTAPEVAPEPAPES